MPSKTNLEVEAFEHSGAKRTNIPSAELNHWLMMNKKDHDFTLPRNTDLDPQLVWRGKDQQDEQDLVVKHLDMSRRSAPKALIDDLRRQTEQASLPRIEQPDLFPL